MMSKSSCVTYRYIVSWNIDVAVVFPHSYFLAQSAGAAEYTDCINECPGYDTKQSDCEAPFMLEHWEMQSNPLLPSLPGLLRSGVVTPDRVLSMGQIKLNGVLMLNWIVWNRTWNHLTVCKQMNSGLFKML